MSKKHWTHRLEAIIENKGIQFSVGSILLIISLTEIFVEIKPAHCLAVIGIQHMVWALPNILQALERIARGAIKR